MKFGQILAYVIADAQFALGRDYFVELLIFKLFSAKWIVAFDLAALLFVSIDFRELKYLIAEFASDPE